MSRYPRRFEAVLNFGGRLLDLPPDALNRAVELVLQQRYDLPKELARVQHELNNSIHARP